MIFSDTLTVTRYAAETIDGLGVGVPGASSTFTCRSSTQRPSSHTLQKLLDGEGTKDAWNVDTTTQLRTRNERTGTPADTVSIDGEDYEVFKVEQHRTGSPIPHYECVVLRVNQGRT